ncbi:hypothetical protein [Limimaricola cinnabarinus]
MAQAINRPVSGKDLLLAKKSLQPKECASDDLLALAHPFKLGWRL